MGLIDIPQALETIRQGGMLIIVDDEDRENEGDLFIPAEKVSPESIAFMASSGRGLICLTLTPDRCDALGLPPMVEENTSTFGTAFTVSIEAREGVTTGISAADRARTIQVAIAPDAQPRDLARPGHIFPLRAMEGGVLRRAGQTEASVDLARLAGLTPAGVICEVMKEDGTMARMPDLLKVSEQFQIPIVTVAHLIRYRLSKENLVRRVAAPNLPTPVGDFELISYESPLTPIHHLALKLGEWEPGDPVLTRVHSECFTGDVLGSLRCDCGPQLHAALKIISNHGQGVVVYLRQEGRGIGLTNKLKAYELQDRGMDTVEANHCLGFRADERDYGVGAQILRDLHALRLKLLTNNPKKLKALGGFGLEIVEHIPLEIPATDSNRAYLQTKKDRMGHTLDSV